MGGIYFDRLRDAGTGRRTHRVGGNASCSPPEYGQGRRSSFAAGWRAVGTHGLDHDRQSDAQQGGRIAALCSRPAHRQISRVDHQVALGANGFRGAGDVCAWRVVVPAVGIFLPDSFWASFDLAGELRNAHVGIAAVSDWGHLDKQLLGGNAYVRGRLAQQSSRGAAGGSPWPSLV